MAPASVSANVLVGNVKLSAVPTVAVWSSIGFATVGAALVVVAAVSLTSMAVPAVHERPGLDQILKRGPVVSASARAREVVPTTRVRAAVAVVMSASSASVRAPAGDRYKLMTE